MTKNPDIILSASGWRKVFSSSGKENDSFPRIGKENTTIALLVADIFANYVIKKTGNKNPLILCGMDTRPTGPSIADAVLRMFLAKGVIPRYIGIATAPEIMACSIRYDGFIYISASHNPIGYNGLKFGLNSGGVLEGSETAKLSKEFLERWEEDDLEEKLNATVSKCKLTELDWIYMNVISAKREALSFYHSFMRRVISDSENLAEQKNIFSLLHEKSVQKKLGIVCDVNGSARSLCIDKDFFEECGIDFYPINNHPGQIMHGICPEGENLTYCACEIEKLQAKNVKSAVIGYTPDCDGDRGNIVYWDEKEKCAKILKAQEVFALSVLSELSYNYWRFANDKSYKPAIVVNGPTSMRIDKIAKVFGAKVFRAEVGEANVVNLARQKRSEGYTVRILGEGSNGGNITYPESVRDPLNTVFALIKILLFQSDNNNLPNLFYTWCKLTNQIESHYSENFTLSNVIDSLPKYCTTETLDSRAIMKIKTLDQSLLKKIFQKLFETEWALKKDALKKDFGIVSYKAVATNGLVETVGIEDFGISGKGGLKILFYADEKQSEPIAFIWMRGSGTEPIFRVMCDVKGENAKMEGFLLQWERDLIDRADK